MGVGVLVGGGVGVHVARGDDVGVGVGDGTHALWHCDELIPTPRSPTNGSLSLHVKDDVSQR
ncbi:MAG: hypothetical protein HY429_00580, partial [Candidatus Levybacteria bacterium]|nr:hypothetical protein [Candidatus Levybacteria bacterium]